MSGLVRVRENGFEHNEGRSRAIAKGLEILDEPTHVRGRARPATRAGGRPVKARTTVAKKAAARRKKGRKVVAPTVVSDPPKVESEDESGPTVSDN